MHNENVAKENAQREKPKFKVKLVGKNTVIVYCFDLDLLKNFLWLIIRGGSHRVKVSQVKKKKHFKKSDHFTS